MNYIYSPAEACKLKTMYDGKFVTFKNQKRFQDKDCENYGWIKINTEPIDNEKVLVNHFILYPSGEALTYLMSYECITKIFTIEDLIIYKISNPNIMMPKFNTYEKEL